MGEHLQTPLSAPTAFMPSPSPGWLWTDLTAVPATAAVRFDAFLKNGYCLFVSLLMDAHGSHPPRGAGF